MGAGCLAGGSKTRGSAAELVNHLHFASAALTDGRGFTWMRFEPICCLAVGRRNDASWKIFFSREIAGNPRG